MNDKDWEKESVDNFKQSFPVLRNIGNGWPWAVWVIAAAEVVEVIWLVFA